MNNLKNTKVNSKIKTNNIITKNKDNHLNETVDNIIEKLDTKFQNLQVQINNKNKGKAGGANTNKNGLAFEQLTKLVTQENHENINIIDKKFITYESKKFGTKNFIVLSKSKLKKYMEENNQKNNNIIPASGCKEPDEAYLDEESKNLFIIEKKFQQCGGSVDEKLQTAHFKIKHYKKLYQNYNIHYIYCLSNWFKKPEYNEVISYNEEIGVKIFWQENYQEKITEFIISKS